ncbi:hypothetical protein RvY_10935 [Ramazzottius varieornatus]|uniref:Uncharacterized protein n=1 Tax=Ramazzottius varieornatus TaxID=947166 RepID=A0A1D1VGG7_RAMVA|nr:hypothetical protein RvY_10935 [Ramazzottius varieornatus]
MDIPYINGMALLRARKRFVTVSNHYGTENLPRIYGTDYSLEKLVLDECNVTGKTGDCIYDRSHGSSTGLRNGRFDNCGSGRCSFQQAKHCRAYHCR